jgi:opacity protein-like surface antigen
MRIFLLSFLFIFLISFFLEAQRRYEPIDKRSTSTGTIIFSLGPEYCFADTKESTLSQNISNNIDFSVGFQIRHPSNFGYKYQINYTNITGSDGSSKSRAYSFASKIWQISAQGEYAINWGRSFGHSSPPHSIYFFLGIGILNCTANLNYDQRAHYSYITSNNSQSNVSAIVPLGLGYQYNFNNNILVGLEYNLRYSLSDYLDGFRPPYPASKSNDMLEGISLTVGYKLF